MLKEKFKNLEDSIRENFNEVRLTLSGSQKSQWDLSLGKSIQAIRDLSVSVDGLLGNNQQPGEESTRKLVEALETHLTYRLGATRGKAEYLNDSIKLNGALGRLEEIKTIMGYLNEEQQPNAGMAMNLESDTRTFTYNGKVIPIKFHKGQCVYRLKEVKNPKDSGPAFIMEEERVDGICVKWSGDDNPVPEYLIRGTWTSEYNLSESIADCAQKVQEYYVEKFAQRLMAAEGGTLKKGKRSYDHDEDEEED